MGNYLMKYCLKKPDCEEEVPLFDYSNQIVDLNEKFEDTYRFLNDEIVPVISELKTRLYYIEVKNNHLNRDITSIKYKISNDDDEFSSIVDDNESNPEIKPPNLIEINDDTLIDIDN
jgi:hypothetical protein